MLKKVGFIGLGNMGKPMSINILRKGYDLRVFDIRSEPMMEVGGMGAKIGANPKELSSQVNVVITMLPGPTEVREVVLGEKGVIEGLRRGSGLIDMSTSSPILTKEIARRLAETGGKMIDAPVTGGIPAAEKGTLTIMVGGDANVFEEHRDILEAMAKEIIYIGTHGMGHAMKLVNQLISHTELISICEAFALGTQAGIDPDTIFKVITQASGNSFIFQYKAPRILNRNFEPGSTVDILYKDLDLATELGRNVGVPLILSNIAREIYQAARALGLSKKDGTSIITLFEYYLRRQIRERVVTDETA